MDSWGKGAHHKYSVKLEDLQKCLVWKDPQNQAAVAKALGAPADSVGTVGDNQLQQDSRPSLVKASRTRKTRKGRLAFRITIIAVGPELLDDDNCATGSKALRDAIATSLGVDDGDGRIRFEYGSVYTAGQPGCIVHIQEA